LVNLLADAYDGHTDVEYVDTFMYGFWGEGHTWPLVSNPFPDNVTAENTFVSMLQYQTERWKKTPMLTDTQPNFSKVGNSELVDRTIRSFNWLRTDTIFIENEQIEALSNRPPWTGVSIEVGISDGSPQSLRIDDGVTYSDNALHQVQDFAPCYFSLWDWHRIQADRLLNYYRQFPDALEELARRIGYRIRPSWVWSYEEGGYPELIIGFVNDGLAALPGALRISVFSEDRKVNVAGYLDAGYPLPGKIRQAKFALPRGTQWKGLRLSAEIEVKGQRYPVRWACRQKLNEDASLTLRGTNGLGDL